MNSTWNKNSTEEHNKKCSAVDYASSFLGKFHDLYEKEESCDTVLISEIDNDMVRAHRLVLSASSEYFRAMFNYNSLNKSNSDEVKVKGFDGVTLKLLIGFIYTGCIELSNQSFESVIKAAHFFQIHSLITVCCDFMTEDLNASNCIGVALLAEQYNLRTLAEVSLKFAGEHFEEMCDEKEFLELNEDRLWSFISANDIQVDSEETLFHCLEKWINHDKQNRMNSVLKLLEHVYFKSLTPKFIIENILLVCNTDECHNLVRKWLQWHVSPEKHSQLGLEQKKPKRIFETLVFASFPSNGRIILQTFNPNPNVHTWSVNHLPDAPSEVRGISLLHDIAAVYNNKLIVPGAVTSPIYCFDFEAEQWSRFPSLRTVCRFHRFVQLNSELYVCGKPVKSLNYAFEKYDSNLCKWRVIATPPLSPNYRVQNLTAVNGLIYIPDGLNGMECYDPVANKWIKKSFPPDKSELAGVNGQLYAFGGKCKLVYRYKPANDMWTISGTLDINVCYLRTVFRNRLITYSKTGETCIGAMYNPENNETVPLPIPHDYQLLENALFTLKMHEIK